MKWLRIRELVRKEFIQLFRDKKTGPSWSLRPWSSYSSSAMW